MSADLSVTLPISGAMERVKAVLFRPFDPGRWLTIGFCAWLALLGQGGGGGGGGGGHVNLGQSRRELDRMWEQIQPQLYWIVPVVGVGLLVLLLLGVVVVWLSSRGQFMFLHCVATNRAEVVAPWHHYKNLAHRLFLFRLVVGVATLLLMLPAVGGAGFGVLRMVHQGAVSWGWGLTSVACVGMAIGAGLCAAVVSKLTRDFVVPLMAGRSIGCRDAWRHLLALFSGHVLDLILYLLFQVGLAILVALVVFALVLVTCCCAGILLAIPFLGTVLLLPVLVFDRAYSLGYLAQFGPDYVYIVDGQA